MVSKMIVAHCTISISFAEAEATLEDEPGDMTKIQNTVCASDPRPLSSGWKNEHNHDQMSFIKTRSDLKPSGGCFPDCVLDFSRP